MVGSEPSRAHRHLLLNAISLGESMNFVVRGSGDNIVLERKDSNGKGTSARPATAEEKLMYDKLLTQAAVIEVWQNVDDKHHATQAALKAENARLTKAANDKAEALVEAKRELEAVWAERNSAQAKIRELETERDMLRNALDSRDCSC